MKKYLEVYSVDCGVSVEWTRQHQRESGQVDDVGGVKECLEVGYDCDCHTNIMIII